jgi:hypothetical protein
MEIEVLPLSTNKWTRGFQETSIFFVKKTLILSINLLINQEVALIWALINGVHASNQ